MYIISIINISHFYKPSPVCDIFINATLLWLTLSLKGTTVERGYYALTVLKSVLQSRLFRLLLWCIYWSFVGFHVGHTMFINIYLCGSVPFVVIMLKELWFYSIRSYESTGEVKSWVRKQGHRSWKTHRIFKNLEQNKKNPTGFSEKSC